MAYYNVKQRKEAVKALAMNGFDVNKTSKELGISAGSLLSWRDKYPEMASKGIAQLDDAITKQAQELEGNYLQKVAQCKTLAINRIIDLVPKETDLDVLLRVVETLDKVSNGDSGSVNTNNIFLQINNQLDELSEE